MAVEVYIPKYGQTVEEVKIVQWFVEDGATVKKGQELLEIETDKTTFFVESEAAGVIHCGPYKAGDTVAVLEVVAVVGKAEDKFVAHKVGEEPAVAEETFGVSETPKDLSEPSEDLSETSEVFVSPRARKLAEARGVDIRQIAPTGGGGVRVAERDVLAYLASAPKATPLAEKLAAETGVNLRTVAGTGPGGKITREDVLAAGSVTPHLRWRPRPRRLRRSPRPRRCPSRMSPSGSRSRACARSLRTGWGRASIRPPASPWSARSTRPSLWPCASG